MRQALLGDPKIIILDEPTAGLDPKERISLRNMVAEIAREKTVLLATHIVSDIECISDYVILIKDGRVFCSKTVNALLCQVQDKVREVSCSDMELTDIQKKFPCSNIYQGKQGFILHVIDQEPDDQEGEIHVNLEDVYLYFFESQLYVC